MDAAPSAQTAACDILLSEVAPHPADDIAILLARSDWAPLMTGFLT